MVRRAPRLLDQEQARWTLGAILRASQSWLPPLTLPGLSQLLARLGLSWKRSGQHIHSPDPYYQAKKAAIDYLVSQAPREQAVLLYLDEVTFYRQPSLANAYEAKGSSQALAERSHQSDTPTRVLASLDHHTGQVVYLRASKIKLARLVEFYQQLVAAYPEAKKLYVVQDNWPLHFHPDVLVALEPQETPFERKLAANWPSKPSAAALRKWGELHLPIQVVPLPTYASWLNPIEKLWRKLRQEELHLHRLADDLAQLRARVDRFLDRFANDSLELLPYLGLYAD